MKKACKTLLICILAILILALAQTLALLAGEASVKAGLPGIFEPVIDAVLYPVLAFFGLKLIAGRKRHFSLRSFRIGRLKLKWYWGLTAVLLPASVVLAFVLTGGRWVVNRASAGDKCTILLFGVLYYSLAAGIVEEMVFRGVIMGTLEREYNRKLAVLLPSILFGLVHIIGNKLSVISIIQLVVAGTFVGIMFSLVEYQSGSFWNNAIIHALWNMSTIGLCHVGSGPDPDSVFTLVINTKNSLISGGDFGVESSIIAIAGYVIVSLIAFVLGRKCGEDRRRSC